MEELLELLNDINPDLDYDTVDNLIDGRVYDSLSIMNLVSELEETFDIEIGPKWLRNENFNSAAAMWNMICQIREED